MYAMVWCVYNDFERENAERNYIRDELDFEHLMKEDWYLSYVCCDFARVYFSDNFSASKRRKIRRKVNVQLYEC